MCLGTSRTKTWLLLHSECPFLCLVLRSKWRRCVYSEPLQRNLTLSDRRWYWSVKRVSPWKADCNHSAPQSERWRERRKKICPQLRRNWVSNNVNDKDIRCCALVIDWGSAGTMSGPEGSTPMSLPPPSPLTPASAYENEANFSMVPLLQGSYFQTAGGGGCIFFWLNWLGR